MVSYSLLKIVGIQYDIYLNFIAISYAMVTNHLQAPYRIYFSPATRIVRFVINFLDIVWCPVKFRYYLKFHGALTAFCRVIVGKMTSTVWCPDAPGRRLHTSDRHPTILF